MFINHCFSCAYLLYIIALERRKKKSFSVVTWRFSVIRFLHDTNTGECWQRKNIIKGERLFENTFFVHTPPRLSFRWYHCLSELDVIMLYKITEGELCQWNIIVVVLFPFKWTLFYWFPAHLSPMVLFVYHIRIWFKTEVNFSLLMCRMPARKNKLYLLAIIEWKENLFRGSLLLHSLSWIDEILIKYISFIICYGSESFIPF